MAKIIIDSRELRSSIAHKLFEKGAEIETKRLEVGDFILSEEVCVELKKVDDFVNSLVDGRLFVQAKNLRANFKRPIYIIEGNFSDVYEIRNVHPNAIRAAILSLLLEYQIPFLFSPSPEETAELLYMLARREQEERNKEIALRGSRKTYSLAEQQQFLIEGFPCVGPKLAKNMLKHFGSCKAVLEASHEDLQKVEKLGPKKAEIIRELLEKDYVSEEEL